MPKIGTVSGQKAKLRNRDKDGDTEKADGSQNSIKAKDQDVEADKEEEKDNDKDMKEANSIVSNSDSVGRKFILQPPMESEGRRESIRKAIRNSMMKQKIKDSKFGNLNRSSIRRRELLEKIRIECIKKRKDELRKQVYRLEMNKSLLEEELKRVLEADKETEIANEDKVEEKEKRKSVERSGSSEHTSVNEYTSNSKKKKKKKKKKKSRA